jgi:hypothetical protein
MLKTKSISVLGLGLIFGAIALQSCDKVTGDIDLPAMTGTIQVAIPPTTDTSSARTLGTGVNTYNIDSFIKANTNGTLGIDNIKKARITSLKLTLANPSAANNFANLQSYYASFYTNTNTTPYSVPEQNNPDEYADTRNLPVDANADLKGYFTGTQFTYSVGGKLRRAITDSLRCTVTFEYMIVVGKK